MAKPKQTKRKRKKQAVVLIHGVGEQVPMDTLRRFVEAVWTTDPSLQLPFIPNTVWSKPDHVSGDLELRRLTTAENRDRKRTDFFEFYWAHLMRRTTLSHVWAWLSVLMLRSPKRIPSQLRGIWATLILTTVLIVTGGVLRSTGQIEELHWIFSAVWALGGIVWPLAAWFLIKYAGDAARYLHVAPPNIQSRNAIRQAGLHLLDELHKSDEYDRIVVVGHSLGSVIGYDVLTHLWSSYHDIVDDSTARPPDKALKDLEAVARGDRGVPDFVKNYQAKQPEYLAELRSSGCPWLVSDFITLGSPLAHAEFLTARRPGEFEKKKEQREFPTCPPVLEPVKGMLRFSYQKDGRFVPHHATVFAATRWTNLYFPCHATVFGDVIAGPVAEVFGPGIKDIPVRTKRWFGLFSHTAYWDLGRAPKDNSHVQAFRDVLQLSKKRGRPNRAKARPQPPLVTAP